MIDLNKILNFLKTFFFLKYLKVFIAKQTMFEMLLFKTLETKCILKHIEHREKYLEYLRFKNTK